MKKDKKVKTIKNEKVLPESNSNSKIAKKEQKKQRTKHQLDLAEIANSKAAYAIELEGLTKLFANGRIVANDNISLKIKTNTIHAICGENGAGKSVLMSTIFGLLKQSSGTIKVNGVQVNFKSAADATKAGLGMVHQHFKLVRVYTLLENIILGAEVANKFGFLKNKKAEQKIKELANKYNFKIDLDRKVFEASVGEQQRAEILKLLYRDANILIFDEPTAVLSDDEIKGFLEMLKFLRENGKTIILITHKLNEVWEVADAISVLRKGKIISTKPIDKCEKDVISHEMTGIEVSKEQNKKPPIENGEPVLVIKDLVCTKNANKKVLALNNFSLNINKGDIFGIAGIEGNGQTELGLALAGLKDVKQGSITFYKNKKSYQIENIQTNEIYNMGISYVAEDRHKHGVILDETVAFNLVANRLDEKTFRKGIFLNKRKIKLNAVNLCSKFNVYGAQKGLAQMRGLSGGNQQKVVFARELTRKHELLVLNQPSRGLDVGVIDFIHKKIYEEAAKGRAVLIVSYELDELLKVCNKIAVIDKGKIVFQKNKIETTKKEVSDIISRANSKTEIETTKHESDSKKPPVKDSSSPVATILPAKKKIEIADPSIKEHSAPLKQITEKVKSKEEQPKKEKKIKKTPKKEKTQKNKPNIIDIIVNSDVRSNEEFVSIDEFDGNENSETTLDNPINLLENDQKKYKTLYENLLDAEEEIITFTRKKTDDSKKTGGDK